MEALGRLFDVGTVVVPVDLGTAANTGSRIHMQNCAGVAFVCYINNGTAGENPTFTLQEHDAASGGNSQDLDVIDHYYKKQDTALSGDETWTEVTQAADAAVTDADWDDANEVLVVFEVHASQLSDGFEWLSVNVDDPGTAQVGAVLGIMYDLAVQRAPDNLAAPQ